MKKKKSSAGTIARTICLLLVLTNQILLIFGKSPLPIEDETVTALVSTLATIMTAAISWWKNNSFTKYAKNADHILKNFKEGAK